MLTCVSTNLRTRSRRPRLQKHWAIGAGLIATVATAVIATVIISAARPQASADIEWPTTGDAALSWGGVLHATADADEPAQIGSITKLVTALVVLDRVPLTEGDAGPTLMMTDDDAAFAKTDPGATESLIPVVAGTPLSLRTLLEYALIASSNTHARALALRIFGSETEYLATARAWLDEHGLQAITIADANGISPNDTATPQALITLGLIADDNPVIRSIVATAGVRTPDGRLVESTNTLLDTQGIDGLKTGHPTNGEYTMLFSATVDGERVIGAIVGSPSLAQRSTDVVRLLAQVHTPAA